MSDTPYDTLVEFVTSTADPKVLWVYGPNSTGKTTLINKLTTLVANVRTFSACYDLADLLFVSSTFIRIIDVNDTLAADMVANLVKTNPNIKFVIEAIVVPPSELLCQLLPMTTVYK